VKICRFEEEGRTGVGIVDADGSIVPGDVDDLTTAIQAGHHFEPAPGAVALTRARILAPIKRPGKILCAGVNYASHQSENPSAVLPSEPFFFSKLPSAVIGPDEAIVMPELTTELDYEVELAVVIGRRARNLSAAQALQAVFGYTIVNDVSARNIQFRDNQITLGKGADTFCPMGPVIVTADEIPDPQSLVLSSHVNGEPRQHESASGMLFSVAELLAHLSRYIALEPGDVVTTGTPAGVGCFMQPPGLLQPGDLVTLEITGIGTLTNWVTAPSARDFG
jgi:2,4-didehydro-3-deoxy-L-rhamnonate hydrolase